jgi:hypothetical protein
MEIILHLDGRHNIGTTILDNDSQEECSMNSEFIISTFAKNTKMGQYSGDSMESAVDHEHQSLQLHFLIDEGAVAVDDNQNQIIISTREVQTRGHRTLMIIIIGLLMNDVIAQNIAEN